ncbi:MAG: hypothetical protein AAB885_03605 [Patescibacteria group bacterium]
MNNINKNKLGLTLGLFGVAIHIVWSVVIMFGWGQFAFDGITRLHAISFSVTVGAMSLPKMFALLAAAFVVWYVVGWVFACIWNWLNK